MKMKVAFFSIFVFMFLPAALLCQESEPTNADEAGTSNRDALNFYLINNYGLSYKFSHGNGFYSGIYCDLSFSVYDNEQDRKDITVTTTETNSTNTNMDEENNSFHFSLSYLFLHDILREERVSLFYGVGPAFGLSTSTSGTEFAGEYFHDQSSTRKSNSYSIGGMALIGLEVKISENIFMFAETQLKGGRIWNTMDYETKDNNEEDNIVLHKNEYETDTWYINLNKIVIGIGVYL